MNARYIPNELQVGIDIGSISHSIAISDGFGSLIKEFEISHTNQGFDSFFKTVDKLSAQRDATVSIAMEGYNGWARPFDAQYVTEHTPLKMR